MSKKVTPVRYDELVGKTVSGAGFSWSTMLIAFTDGTVLALTAEDSDEGAMIDFKQSSHIELLSQRWAGDAVEAGLITHEEYCAFREQAKKREISTLKKKLADMEGICKP